MFDQVEITNCKHDGIRINYLIDGESKFSINKEEMEQRPDCTGKGQHRYRTTTRTCQGLWKLREVKDNTEPSVRLVNSWIHHNGCWGINLQGNHAIALNDTKIFYNYRGGLFVGPGIRRLHLQKLTLPGEGVRKEHVNERPQQLTLTDCQGALVIIQGKMSCIFNNGQLHEFSDVSALNDRRSVTVGLGHYDDSWIMDKSISNRAQAAYYRDYTPGSSGARITMVTTLGGEIEPHQEIDESIASHFAAGVAVYHGVGQEFVGDTGQPRASRVRILLPPEHHTIRDNLE